MISDGGLGAGGPPAIGVTPTGALLGAAPVAATPTAVVDDSLPYVSPFPAFRPQENRSLLSSSVAVQSDTPATVSVAAQIDDDSIVVPITSWYHGVNNPP